MPRLTLLILLIASALCVDTARAVPAGRFREQAERIKEQSERRAGRQKSNEEDADPRRSDRILAAVDKARLQYTKAVQAADATMRKSFDRQWEASTAKGDLDQAKLVEQARASFNATAQFEAHDLPILTAARQQWLKARERAARDA